VSTSVLSARSSKFGGRGLTARAPHRRFGPAAFLPSLRALAAAALLSSSGIPTATAQEVATPVTGEMAVANQIVQAFDALFSGPHAGIRAVHGKGVLCEGTFTATDAARSLSRAPHFQGQPVPVVVRLSNFASVPASADGDPSGSPRGMAIKFMLPDDGDTDIVAHSYNGFPVSAPEDFLSFLRALAASDPRVLSGFLASHPAAKTFVEAPKPAPVSFATEAFYGVDAFRFTNADGVQRFGRYRIEPGAGQAHLSRAEAAQRSPDYLSEDLASRLQVAPVEFRLLVQLPAMGDPITDGSTAWPNDRPFVDAGTIRLRALVPQQAAQQRRLLFTPLNLVGGIASSGDPLLSARTRAYRISLERRARAAAAGE
jgi:catalase